jgi:uncharacterized protein YjbJ (UPF0337 family)
VQLGNVDLNKLRGIGDKFVGLNKEFLGTLIGNERLQQEGEAQQERAAEELKGLRAEAKAETKQAKADALEQKQRAAQRAKQDA